MQHQSTNSSQSAQGLQSMVSAFATSALQSFRTSGIVKQYKRLKGRVTNRFSAGECEVIILVGTEKGSTAKFAAAVFDQLLAAGVRVYIEDMNKYQVYPSAKQLLCFCSTYGDGKAPRSASRFKKRFKNLAQPNDIGFSVVGFGASSYSKFCAFAIKTDKRFAKQNWAKQVVQLHTVNKRSVDDFVLWAQDWSSASGYALSADVEFYRNRICTKK